MRIGIDLGGTKMEAALMDAEGRIGARVRAPTPHAYAPFLAAIATLVAETEAEAGVRADVVGVASPGSLSPVTGLARNSNSTWINGRPLLQDLTRAFGRPVRIANDANCFALSEATDGAGKGAHVVFGAILGTGCGGGVVVDGRVIEGASGIAGEWGHIPLPWPRGDELPFEPCWCGRPGCLETWISGSGLARWGSQTLGRSLKAEEIVAASRAGDAGAQACMTLYCDRLARALAIIIDILDPDIIVLGGGLSNVEEIYDGVREKLPPYVFSDLIGARIVKNVHGDSSGVRGAAWLWRPEEIA
ncbi:MAG: ROK family protein [Hyphomonadaceae bacterium]